MMDAALTEELNALGQEHLLSYLNELSEDQRASLEADIRHVDWKQLKKIYEKEVLTQLVGNKLKPNAKIDDDLLRELPSDCIEGTMLCNPQTLKDYRTTGLINIGQGKVAALLLAGGQGTRLGVDYPKGMYDIGLPSHKTLFQLQAERILKLSEPQEMATGEKTHILWYIMTSEATMEQTKDFFHAHDYFGLNPSSIVFFEQDTLPCFDFNGKVLLDEKHKLSRSPNGNGGLYEALHKNGIINHMVSNGVEYVHVYCVDNVLVRVCDPLFMGYCITAGVDAGAKVVEKLVPNESVGVLCKVNNKVKVIEYSELSENVAQRRDEATGKLVFHAGNICDHFFTVNFLKKIGSETALRYHLAIKKIPHVSLEDGKRIIPTVPNGIKLERFIFDVFEYADKFAAWGVKRQDEFAPLKNAIGTEKDNPITALKALLRSHELGLLDC